MPGAAEVAEEMLDSPRHGGRLEQGQGATTPALTAGVRPRAEQERGSQCGTTDRSRARGFYISCILSNQALLHVQRSTPS